MICHVAFDTGLLDTQKKGMHKRQKMVKSLLLLSYNKEIEHLPVYPAAVLHPCGFFSWPIIRPSLPLCALLSTSVLKQFRIYVQRRNLNVSHNGASDKAVLDCSLSHTRTVEGVESVRGQHQ